MSAIVPFIAEELAKPQNAAMALNLFGEAGKAAAGLFKAHKAKRSGQQAKAAMKGRRKARAQPVHDLGHTPMKAENRRNARQQGITLQNNKQLYTKAIIEIEKNVAADEAINKRARDVILHKGSKLCFTVKNVTQTTVYFNWAVVIPKASNTINAVDFLRGNTVERDVAIDNSMTSLDVKCLPINTDLYNVVMTRRLQIAPDSDKSASVNEGRDFRVIEKYLKTNRKIYFNGSASTPLQNMHMVWWCDFYGSPTGSQSTPVQIEWKIVDYFQDVN